MSISPMTTTATLPPPGSTSADDPIAPVSPRDLPYSADFEDSIMDIVLNPPSTSDTNAASLPTEPFPSIPLSSLPLPLSDPRRIHPSLLPGVRLTHPAGHLSGGPGPRLSNPEQQRLVLRLLSDAGLASDGDEDHRLSRAEAARVLEAAQERAQRALRERMERRKEARAANEAVLRDMRVLEAQRETEVRVLEGMRRGG